MSAPQNLVEYVQFKGGLNLVTPASNVPPGQLLNALNYEPDINGGYRRFRGYERFDGRPRPSDGVYEAISCTLSVTLSPGDSLVIGAATCKFLQVVTGGMLVYLLAGTVPAATSITRASAPVGTTGTPAILPYATAALEEAQIRVDMAALLRANIGVVPGVGPVRGVALYGGKFYAWRDNVGATASVMHEASATGWTPITLKEEISFTNANTSVGQGDTLTQGGVTATVVRMMVTTGTLVSGTNSGFFVISTRAGGNFAAGAATTTGGGALTLSGAQGAQAFPPGGTYRFKRHNFYGGESTERLYGANGIGRAFEFDGTNIAFIRTGAAIDTPTFVEAWINYLFLAHGSSLTNSSVDEPHRFITTEGASEKAVGATITGIAVLPGESLGVATTKSIHAMVGRQPSEWVFQTISPQAGGVAGSFQVMSLAHAVDSTGILGISPSQTSAAFEFSTVSRLVQPLIDATRNIVVTSCVVRQKNVYRVFCSDGRVLSMYAEPGRIEFGMLSLPVVAHCVISDNDVNGVERVLIGASNGYVYELDRPSTFDGSDVESASRIWYMSQKNPRTRKRYRKLAVDMNAELYATIQVQPDFSFGINEISSAIVETVDTMYTFGAGGIWESSNWDEFFWDASEIAQPEVSLAGTGTNIALTFYSKTKLDFGHVLQGAFIHYTPRRLQR